jgi:hypothetical protein
MAPFVEGEIITRLARIDPALGAGRAATRLIAIGHRLAAIAAERNGAIVALDLLLEGAAVCSAAATTERFAAALAEAEACARLADRQQPAGAAARA